LNEMTHDQRRNLQGWSQMPLKINSSFRSI
jgi:hypothetical protein